MTKRRAQRTQHPLGQFAWLGFPVLAAVLAVVGWIGRAEPADRRPSPVPVDVAAYTCPLLGNLRVTTGQVTAGSSAVATLYPGATSLAADPRHWVAMSPRGDAMSVEQRGRKSGAVGFVRGTMARSLGGGLVLGSCPGVADESWFVGLGARLGHESMLVLTNIGGSPAVADINLWAPDGPVPAIGNKGLLVPPHASRVVSIHSLAAGEGEVGVQVIRRRGALSTTAIDTSRAGRRGSESAVGVAPAKHLRLAAIPAGGDSRTLLLLNPGDVSTRATVQVIGSGKPFTPQGLSNVRLPAGKLVQVALPPQRQGFGLEISAAQAIVGAVRVASGSADFGYALAVHPIEHGALAPVVPGLFPVVVVTSTGKAAKFTITAFDVSMHRLAQVSGDVAAASTRTPDLRALARVRPAYLQIQSTEPVTAAAIYTSGQLLAILPLTDAPIFRPGPDVMAGD